MRIEINIERTGGNIVVSVRVPEYNTPFCREKITVRTKELLSLMTNEQKNNLGKVIKSGAVQNFRGRTSDTWVFQDLSVPTPAPTIKVVPVPVPTIKVAEAIEPRIEVERKQTTRKRKYSKKPKKNLDNQE